MNLTLITPPVGYPVTLDEAKDYCRVDINDEDTLVSSLIGAAVTHAESITGRRFVSQQWRMDIEKFTSEILLPYPNLISVDSIAYYDTANAQQTLNSSIYDVNGIGHIGSVKASYGQSFPSVYPRDDAVQITFTCGYSAVPEGIKTAVNAIVSQLYYCRGERLDNDFVCAMLGPYILRGFQE